MDSKGFWTGTNSPWWAVFLLALFAFLLANWSSRGLENMKLKAAQTDKWREDVRNEVIAFNVLATKYQGELWQSWNHFWRDFQECRTGPKLGYTKDALNRVAEETKRLNVIRAEMNAIAAQLFLLGAGEIAECAKEALEQVLTFDYFENEDQLVERFGKLARSMIYLSHATKHHTSRDVKQPKGEPSDFLPDFRAAYEAKNPTFTRHFFEEKDFQMLDEV